MASSTQSPFEVKSFEGGITDDLFEQDYLTAAVIDNFVITADGKLDSRNGSIIDDEDNGQIPAGVQRVAALINYANNDKLFVQSGVQLYFRDPSAYSILTGPTGNDLFSTGTPSNAPAFTQWNKHLFLTSDAFPRPMKVYKDDAGDYQLRNNGLPGLATDPVVTAGGVGSGSYLYAFHYEYTYMVGDQEFQELGPTTTVSLTDAQAPDISTVPITVIPALSNGLTDNYDVTVIKVFIYRTIDGGDTFYKIGEVTNGTTTFNDTFSDDSIQNNLILYTDDGTLDFDPAPEAKYITVVNSTGYYGFVKEDGEEFAYRVRQSIPAVPGACPESFYVDVEDIIVGVGSTKSIPLIFCRRHVYRLEQGFDRFGRGAIVPIRISDTAGCISHLSIVQAENFCVWWGQDGVYSTDGYQVIKISDGINDIYRGILDNQSQANRVYGKFNEDDRRLYWGCQSSAANGDNDILLVLDLRWGMKPKSVFTTWSGEGGSSFRPTALEFFSDLFYRGDSRGYVFKHSADYTTDPKVNTLVDPDQWAVETIIWTYMSTHINFGSTFFRKMPTRILLTCANKANTTIQILVRNDDGSDVRELKIIRWLRNFTWGDDDFIWGDPDCVWNQVGLIEQWRRFPARRLRLSYMQIKITNGFGVVTTSDFRGTATFNNAANTATLDTPLTYVWPPDCEDYVVKTSFDDYEREFQVTTRNSDSVITLLDIDNMLPTGSYDWEMWGFRKGEPLKILSYNVHWNNVDQNQSTFQSGQDGTNT